MSGYRALRQEAYTPNDLGAGVTGFSFDSGGFLLTNSSNSNGFGVGGFNQLHIHYEVTRVAATDLTFFLAFKPPGGSNFGRGRFGDADPATGIQTYRQWQHKIASLATAAEQNGDIDIAINLLGDVRLEAITGTAATTDRVKFWITLGNV